MFSETGTRVCHDKNNLLTYGACTIPVKPSYVRLHVPAIQGSKKVCYELNDVSFYHTAECLS